MSPQPTEKQSQSAAIKTLVNKLKEKGALRRNQGVALKLLPDRYRRLRISSETMKIDD